ncbi:RWD domain-containing protein 2B [Maniola hyperantus]|uniref:RWD domain-containing protein 2B n=1 Tax=Aphantopus hyperantus TaxID=2795564 RepID=UPI001569C5FD|nr:RWD domain-containing protein 2B [Maniola hyperantus]
MELEESLRSKLSDCFTQQLSEIELITCMYPNKEELCFTDNVLRDMKHFVNHETLFKPNHLDFTLNLFKDGLKLEVSINLPSFYPEEEPDIYVRCNQLNRQQETALNTDLSIYLKDNHFGEPCLYTAISWIQENLEKYNTTIIQPNSSTVTTDKDTTREEKFARLWIFSHHIYNKRKREEITKMAREYKLTGFCLPGKPGIICVEGIEDDCNEWWKIIKSMSWKKITLRKTEIFDLSVKIEEQRFKNFEEIHFQNPSSKRSNHADMSEFSKYMEQFGLTRAFNDFFGLCNST